MPTLNSLSPWSYLLWILGWHPLLHLGKWGHSLFCGIFSHSLCARRSKFRPLAISSQSATFRMVQFVCIVQGFELQKGEVPLATLNRTGVYGKNIKLLAGAAGGAGRGVRTTQGNTSVRKSWDLSSKNYLNPLFLLSATLPGCEVLSLKVLRRSIPEHSFLQGFWEWRHGEAHSGPTKLRQGPP